MEHYISTYELVYQYGKGFPEGINDSYVSMVLYPWFGYQEDCTVW